MHQGRASSKARARRQGKVQDADTKSHLADADVTLRAYDSFLPAVRDLAAKGSKFMLDPTKTSWAVLSAIQVHAPTP